VPKGAILTPYDRGRSPVEPEAPRANPAPVSRRLRGVLLAILAAAALCLAIPAGVHAGTSAETEIKIGFLYNFTKLVDWPQGAFEGDRSPIVIGIAGDPDMAASFSTILAVKPSGGHPIQVRFVPDSGKLPPCHMLFIRSSSRLRVSEALEATAGKPVLLVGETEAFLAQGGMVNFIQRSGRVRYEVNPKAAEKRGIKLRSGLLKLATPAEATGEP
jgi:hypothetical protein